jgi:tRNA(fMet)-specific endonuclease VapC
MKYLLDTNICIYLIKQQPREVLERFQELTPGEVAISTVTVAEMTYGVKKSLHQGKNQAALEAFLAPLEIVDFDYKAASHYGAIRAELELKGVPVGAYDLMIAAQTRSLGLTLVTNNEREFRRIPDLVVENWVSG